MVIAENIDFKLPEMPEKIQSISDLPKGRTLILENGMFAVPEGLREHLAIFELTEYAPDVGALEKLGLKPGSPAIKSVFLIVANEFATSLQTATYKKNLGQSREYLLLRVIKIDKQLMSALYSQDGGFSLEAAGSNELMIYFDKMISDAIENHVSDMHIEKRRSQAIIRMRKHGELMEYKSAISPQYATDLCAVIYNVLAENKDITFAPDTFQAAQVNRIIDGVEVMLRYQSLPVYPEGFDVVLRVLPIGRDDESFLQLDQLGYSSSQVKTIIDIISKPVGALIISGTTGSGKSTTLKNLLMFVNAAKGYKAKIYTIEDPPEYRIPRVSQLPVIRLRSKTAEDPNKSPFADPLMATMRGDPDVLMIGEVRDHFTADGLKKATQSGHQVMSTTHASSALATVERLSDFGLKPSVLGSPEFLTGLIYQKLLPILCENCSVSFKDVLSDVSVTSAMLELSERLEEVSNFETDIIKLRGKGCSHCSNMGVTGRTVCAEVIAPDFTMLRLFREQDATATYEYWRSLSDNDQTSSNMDGKPALEHALYKMRLGIVSPLDIEADFGPVNLSKKMLEQAKNSRKIAGGGRKPQDSPQGSNESEIGDWATNGLSKDN